MLNYIVLPDRKVERYMSIHGWIDMYIDIEKDGKLLLS